MLTWARERAGMSLTDVAQRVKKDEGVIADWEAGTSVPTYPQLEKLAYSVFKRPVALFFFPDPPQELDPEHSFRTLPDFEARDLAAQTRYRIREAQAFQLSLRELTGHRNPAETKLFREVTFHPAADVQQLAAEVRHKLGVSLAQQTHRWRSYDEALKGWRSAVESRGIFVFKNTFKQREVSGFCLYDSEFPIVYLNNSTAPARQIFTLFHEVAHILAQTSGITKVNDSYIGALRGEARDIEVFCNRFAAELLVPEGDVKTRVTDLTLTDNVIHEVAREYKVSREVIARRLLDLRLLTRNDYEERVQRWQVERDSTKTAPAGGDYYATKVAYLGDNYLRLAFSRFYQGLISGSQLADHLGVRESSVSGVERFYLEHAAS